MDEEDELYYFVDVDDVDLDYSLDDEEVDLDYLSGEEDDVEYLREQLNSSELGESPINLIDRCLTCIERNMPFRTGYPKTEMRHSIDKIMDISFKNEILDSEIVLRIFNTAIHLYPNHELISYISSKSSYIQEEVNQSENTEELSFPSENHIITTQYGERMVTLNYVGYFLHFVNQVKFLHDSKRFTDITEFDSKDHFLEFMKYYAPEFVLTLFQYGARIFGEEQHTYPSEKLFITIIMCFMWIGCDSPYEWNDKIILERSVSEIKPVMKRMIAIFKILMRVVPNPQEITYKVALRAYVSDGNDDLLESVPIFHILQAMYETLFPGLNFGMNEPSSLKHLCRYYIRLRMNENWKLPYGIDELQIPHTLKCYLNLMDD